MIKEFKGEYEWLSNFEPVKIVLDGIEYSSVEHAYMSAKTDDPEWKAFCSDSNNPPGRVKRKSRGIQLRPDWEDVKEDIMRECLNQKFSQEPYRTKLLETESKYIQEGNWWGDTYWGIFLKTNQGKNRLGMIIMNIRLKLKQESEKSNDGSRS